MKQAAFCLLIVLLLVAGAELSSPGFFLMDDVQAHYIPGLDEIGHAWLQGEVPLISRYTWCAGGLAGEYQYGSLNPFIQAAAVLTCEVPYQGARAALMVAFFGWITLWGALRLGRELGLKPGAALALAAVFCLNRYALDLGWRVWLPTGVALSWLPWFWLSLVQNRLSIPLLVTSLSLVVTGGSPFLVVAAGLLGLFYFVLALKRRQWRRAAMLAVAALCALAISSGALVLLKEYSQSAMRSQRPSWLYRLEPWHGLTYLLPGFSFWSETTENSSLYTCLGWIPCLGILGVWLERKSLSPLWWLALLWLTLGISPSVAGMRFSMRWLHYLNPLLGLLGLEYLNRQTDNPEHRFGKATWAAIALGQLLGFGLDSWRNHPHQWLPLPLLLLLVFCWTWNNRPQQRQPLLLGGVWVGLLLTTPITPLSYHQYPQGKIVRPLVRPDRTWLSLYSWQELLDSRPNLVVPARYADSALVERLPIVNGYSPLLAAPIIRAWTFSNVGSLEPTVRNVNNIALGTEPGGLMDKLEITGLMLSPQWQPLAPQLARTGWRLLGHEGLVQIWVRDRPFRPTFESLTQVQICKLGEETAAASLQPDGPAVIRTDRQPPGLYRFAPLECGTTETWRNGASCQLAANPGNRPALIAVHRPWFQGYRAFLGGKEMKLDTLNLQQMAVEIPPGSPGGRLEVVYRPHALKIGLIAGILGLLGAAILSWIKDSSLP
ncbi:hypothetical protein JST97_14495 [bacterium]|nr:hypothetical protein [bacterium]